MTIAIVSMIRDSWGGSEELWAAMAEEALNRGHTVVHLSYRCAPPHPKMKALEAKGLRRYTRPSYKPVSDSPVVEALHKAIFYLQKRMNGSIRAIFDGEPDIVLYNGTCYSVGDEKELLHYVNKSGVRFFILGHFNREDGSDLLTGREDAVSQAYASCRKVFFVSERSIQNARRRLASGIPNILVVRNPVNMVAKEYIPILEDRVAQFAMVGNLRIVHKGQDIALEVLSTVRWQQREWHLNIYGTGEDEGRLRRLVGYFGLEKRVSFHGRVSEIREVWRNNHVLLMPSHMEGMPLAVVEAMICGRPPVLTDVGGHGEWVDDGLQGFLAEAPTVFSFGKAMERLWAERENWAAIGHAAHERAMQQYDPESGKTMLRLIGVE